MHADQYRKHSGLVEPQELSQEENSLGRYEWAMAEFGKVEEVGTGLPVLKGSYNVIVSKRSNLGQRGSVWAQ